MADNIPDGILRAHIIEAINRLDAGAEHQFSESTVYDVAFEGHRYPPKAVVGIAAEILTGAPLGPKDFKGGQESKCFRILQKTGFQIALKDGLEPKSAWLFQGNPQRFDIDDYLSRYSYIYWRAPRHKSEIRVGDPCIIWRSGAAAGAVAIGRISEGPQPMSEVNFPECLGEDLWRDASDSLDTIKVGIQIDEVRLDEEAGFIPRNVFVENSRLAESLIICSPQGTIFRLAPDEVREAFALWNSPLDLASGTLPSALEGAQRLRKHYSRERSRSLIKRKKEQFASEHEGQVFCEVCRFDFSQFYPSKLGYGFIEVHHLAPLFIDDQPRRTTLHDLLLLCSNCHRMVHRSKDVDENLQVLRDHFRQQTANKTVLPTATAAADL